MTVSFLEARFGGPVLDLGACSLGQNLNRVCIRGFAQLDEIAGISGPDTHNGIENPDGTQRDLKPHHSKQALDYALGQNGVSPGAARAFPEVILNVRNMELLEFYDVRDGLPVELPTVFDALDLRGMPLGVRVRLNTLVYPVEPYTPEISRLDGNHRLSAAWAKVEADPDEAVLFPVVPFSMFLALSVDEERKVFVDINSNHVGVDKAVLQGMETDARGEEMKSETAKRALWLAWELGKEHRAFENLIVYGGAGTKKSFKEKMGYDAPLKVTTMESACKVTLRSSDKLAIELEDSPDAVLGLVDAYWKAVKAVFPEAWADKKQYILFETIGLSAFAQLGGNLIEQAVHSGNGSTDYFKPYLLAIKSSVSLQKSDHAGIAGAGGIRQIYTQILKAASTDTVGTFKVKELYKPTGKSLEEAFGE